MPAPPKQPVISFAASASVDERLRSEILRICSDAYEEDFTPYLDLLTDAVHVLARVDGILVSHAAWVERELRVVGCAPPLQAAYIEAVATAVEHQSKGYGSTVMAAIPGRLDKYEIAALSPSEQRFYSRLGWRLWLGPLQFRKGQDIHPTPDEEVMVLFLPNTPPNLNLSSTLETDWRRGDVW